LAGEVNPRVGLVIYESVDGAALLSPLWRRVSETYGSARPVGQCSQGRHRL